ncbi:MAG TPA: alginate export family protein [Phycisphaerae bacterium]|nr:alginate export family protein [Phycisphaerae bacterium]
MLACLLAAGLSLAGAVGVAQAQDDGRRVYDEQLRVQLDRRWAEAREIGLDAGGWFSFALFHYDDAGARRERVLRQYQLRGWGSANIQGVHQFYVRGLLGYDDWNAGLNPVEEHGDQYSGFEIERAWYQFDLGRMLRNQTGKASPLGLRVKAGRAFAEIGTGFVLSTPLDMVQFDASLGNWKLMALLGKTIHKTRNLDDSSAVFDHQRRCLWGAQLTYTGFDQHRPFAYFLDNHDQTKADPFESSQAYGYSSRYVAVGSEGTLLLPNLRYQAEAVGEFGKNYSRGVTDGRDSICAMATDFLLEYLFQVPTHPRISFEHIWASGDDDRQMSATATVLGNEPGTNDNAFNAFGFRDVGLAFSPRISNLHVHALGGSLYPLEKHKVFKRMEVGTKVFFYHKSSSGPISDTTTTSDTRWLGWEWDVYCNWRLTSDLSWTIRYGAFMPGGAFADNSCRQFLMTAINLSF